MAEPPRPNLQAQLSCHLREGLGSAGPVHQALLKANRSVVELQSVNTALGTVCILQVGTRMGEPPALAIRITDGKQEQAQRCCFLPFLSHPLIFRKQTPMYGGLIN